MFGLPAVSGSSDLSASAGNAEPSIATTATQTHHLPMDQIIAVLPPAETSWRSEGVKIVAVVPWAAVHRLFPVPSHLTATVSPS
ncbi:hypothetical protein Amac_021500 [Acrocarpospora macrocephala]|uniref:Uncharacterized protein n=1 Tax=Acrocarpospora macrocephala TaxID=150177 RepID=A0A5M3WHV2_9ACTN|nr:hypothetical protein Amac_021500 [Acrocarpospora macrocephala]